MAITEDGRLNTHEALVSPAHERVFLVAVPLPRAWAAFTEAREREAWMMPPGRDQLTNPDTPVMDGFEPGEIKVGAVDGASACCRYASSRRGHPGVATDSGEPCEARVTATLRRPAPMPGPRRLPRCRPVRRA